MCDSIMETCWEKINIPSVTHLKTRETKTAQVYATNKRVQPTKGYISKQEGNIFVFWQVTVQYYKATNNGESLDFCITETLSS